MAGPAYVTRYTPSRRGFALMATGPEVRSALFAIAYKGKGIAVGLSASFANTGHYAASFEVVDGGNVRLAGHMRARVYLVNKAAYAAVVEFGRKGHAGERVLGRTLDALKVTT